GHIHNQNVVNFLIQELRRDDESLRLAAAGALKQQDPVLVIEPMLEALNKPEHYLASRIYDVLEALGPKLVPVILNRIHQCNTGGQIIMVQLLGTFGDESVIPTLLPYLESNNYMLKKMTVEALSKLQGQDICPILTNLLTDDNWQIRLMAAEAIGRGHFTGACPALREAYVREPDNLVKELMADILHTIDTNNEAIPYLWTWQRSKQINERTCSTS
ncbi:MAG: HEAT repeat domain-containing protein, partial [Peptococcaceae bacterium]|nr:HEAT repeat domain-containing protein [Peptococcaceae bacterium]